jgi:hypothetical protein
MAESPAELKKLTDIASDLELAPQIRERAIEQIGQIGSYDALLGLTGLGAKEALTVRERELALRMAIKIVKLPH